MSDEKKDKKTIKEHKKHKGHDEHKGHDKHEQHQRKKEKREKREKIEKIESKEEKSRTLEPSVPHRLENLVGYSEGAVVSRTIAKTKTATVTLFSFDQGQALSEHSAPFDAIVQVLEGEVELVIGGKPVIAKAGETVIMPADIPHAVYAVKQFKMLLTMLRD